MKLTEQRIDTYLSDRESDLVDGPDLQAEAPDEMRSLRLELDSERDSRLRLAAEFDNYRRRVRREQSEAANAGKRELLEELISIADDLDLAVANLDGATEAIADVVRMTRRRFASLLAANGVEALESLGRKFDPEHHEAFDVADGPGTASGTVHKELRRGYLWGGRLLRPALVTVTK